MENIIIEKEFSKINKTLSKMTMLVIDNIDGAIRSFADYDLELAQKVIDNDEQINAMELKIEQDCIVFIAKNQPVAGDLRVIQSIYKISTDLERIGDQAKDISNLVIQIENNIAEKLHEKTLKMANEVKEMVSDAIRSFLNRKIDLAFEVVKKDLLIDKMYYDLKKVITEKLLKNDIIKIEDYISLLFIVKYLEKMGDHAENIANWIIYNVEGEFYKKGE